MLAEIGYQPFAPEKMLNITHSLKIGKSKGKNGCFPMIDHIDDVQMLIYFKMSILVQIVAK